MGPRGQPVYYLDEEVRRAALVACAANGVPAECVGVVAAGMKIALDEVIAGEV